MSKTRNIKDAGELKAAIQELERKIEVQEVEMKAEFSQVKEDLHPKKISRNIFTYLAETPEIQKTIVNTAIGFILGYASKKAKELLNEEALNSTIENLVNSEINRLEYKAPESLLAKGISLFRKHTPPQSPIYPFVRYK